jgi:protein TonB
MKKERKDKNFIRKPVYPGGPTALRNYVRTNLRYPKEALEKGVEGTVSLKYTIDHLGKVIDAHIISGLGHGCDEEAIRLVKSLKFEVAKTRGVKVQFHKDLHVHFRLPKKQKQAARTPVKSSFVYSTTATQKPSGGYHYTITIQRNENKTTE